MSESKTLMVALTAFYLDGKHVPPGAQVVIKGEDVRGAIASRLAVPFRMATAADE
jgi:hypothetical protein